MSDFSPYETDVLFLLVGANPLPNYVAACLLTRPDATLYLLHSLERGQNTHDVAERLAAALKRSSYRPNLTVHLRGVSRSDPDAIERQMKTLLKEVSPRADVGLNYTGGTKAMSVHVYHALRPAFPRGCFSYLDAASLTMVIKREGTPTQEIPVGREVELDFETLFSLHGYKVDKIRCKPEHSELYRALAQVCATPQGFHEWKGPWDKQKQSKGWLKSGGPLKSLPTRDEYPHLGPVIEVFERWGGKPEQIAQRLGQSSLNSCCNWFDGTWLEEYTFECLSAVAERLAVETIGIDLKPKPVTRREKEKPKNLQLDVAAIIGYQLFAISCITSKEEGGETKKHLFEAFVRARQLGGDEARVVLVCCVGKPQVLQREVEQSWDAEGKIRVFGQDHLLDLAAWLEDWFQTANREV